MTNAIANKGNLQEVYNDCSSTAPTGQVRYVRPNAAEVNQGKIVRDEAAVKKTQEALGIKGADADGMWGDKTTEAVQRRIEQFQKDNGLSVTGRYTAETAEKMKKDPANKALGEALDGARNRGLLDRVYKPMKREEVGVEDASCRRDGGTTSGPVQKAPPAAQSTAPVQKEPLVAKTTGPAQAASEAKTTAPPPTYSIANAEPDLTKPAGILRRSIERTDGPVRPTASDTNIAARTRPADSMIDNAPPKITGVSEGLRDSLKDSGPQRRNLSDDLRSQQTFVQPIARFVKGADGKWGEAPEGQVNKSGTTYSPSLGGDVSRTAPAVSEKDLQGFAKKLGGMTGAENASAVLKGFETNIGSIGSLSTTIPSLATPGIAAPSTAFKLDTFKP